MSKRLRLTPVRVTLMLALTIQAAGVSFDKSTRAWHSATFPEPIGSVMSIERIGAYLYLTSRTSLSVAPPRFLMLRLSN